MYKTYQLGGMILNTDTELGTPNQIICSLLGHPLWRSWDLALDSIMTELSLRKIRPTRPALHGQISTFFFDQLTEFKVNLTQYGKYDKVDSRQLPVLLQVGRRYE